MENKNSKKIWQYKNYNYFCLHNEKQQRTDYYALCHYCGSLATSGGKLVLIVIY